MPGRPQPKAFANLPAEPIAPALESGEGQGELWKAYERPSVPQRQFVDEANEAFPMSNVPECGAGQGVQCRGVEQLSQNERLDCVDVLCLLLEVFDEAIDGRTIERHLRSCA